MLHLIKKRIARLQQPLVNNVPNGEYADMRQRLSSIKAALKYTLSMLNSSNRIWILQIQQQRQFSERFHDAYPSTQDDTYIVAKHFADESQALYDKFVRDVNENAAVYLHIHSQIKTYISEIEAIEAQYGGLVAAKTETGRYQAKLDAMERGRRAVDPSRRQRNIQKLDTIREEYRRALRNIVEAQKKTYAKHPVVFKAALTAYWLSHEKHVNALVQSLEKTQSFANAYESEMKALDVTNLKPDDLARLASIDTSFLNAIRFSNAPGDDKRPRDDIIVRDGAGDVSEFKDANENLPPHMSVHGTMWSPVTTPGGATPRINQCLNRPTEDPIKGPSKEPFKEPLKEPSKEPPMGPSKEQSVVLPASHATV